MKNSKCFVHSKKEYKAHITVKPQFNVKQGTIRKWRYARENVKSDRGKQKQNTDQKISYNLDNTTFTPLLMIF